MAKKENIDFSLITGRSKFLLVTKNIRKFEDAGFLKVYRLGPTPIDLVSGFFIYALGKKPPILDKIHFASLYSEAASWKISKSADIFHVHGIWGDLEYVNLGVNLSRRFHKPLVITLHGGFVGEASQSGMPLYLPAVKSILEDAAAITTYSKEVFGFLESIGLAEKSHLIPNFVDTERFQNPNTAVYPHETTVVYVGRLEPSLNPEIVVQAFQKVNKQYPNSKLRVVGYGSQFEPLKGLVKELKLDDAVSLVGKQTDVRPFLWEGDIFVASNLGYIASLEAMSAGLAVVAPNFGVLKETIIHENNGLLVEQHDSDQLASAITRLIGDKEFQRKLALNGAQSAKNYDIREVAPKIAQVYRSVMKN